MHSSEHFIVPTDGKPIKGLIQDHIVSGLSLMMQDTFLDRRHYEMLVYEACSALPALKPKVGAGAGGGGGGGGGVQYGPTSRVKLMPPCVRKPAALWTGKQVVSTLLLNLLRGRLPLSGRFKTKVPKAYWTRTHPSCESVLYIRNCLVVHGIIDKAAYGKFGLVVSTHTHARDAWM